jgi:RimK family alpha-L-glutamate ligase
LIKNRDELIEIREKLKLIPHLYQEFISSSFGKDARIIVIGGKMASCILRKNENDFRSNVELGATAYKFNPPQSFIDTAEKAAKILNLDYCGVDILFSEDNEPILCEVNSNAYFTASEKISGVDIAQIYCDHILKKIM